MYNTRAIGQAQTGDGIYAFEAEFFSEHLTVRGEIISPELRLSDHLNSSQPSVEVRPIQVERITTGAQIELSGTHAQITKAHLLFIVPVREPNRPARSDNIAWTWTVTRRCWAALGSYVIVGKVHAEAGRDPRLILRSLEHKQFLPCTEATITTPDGTTRSCGTVIINRQSLEILAVRDL